MYTFVRYLPASQRFGNFVKLVCVADKLCVRDQPQLAAGAGKMLRLG